MNDIMIDIETLSNRSYAVICSIGAVEFDLATGETGREFYQRVDIQSCLNAGLRVNGSTIQWWLQQSEEARNELAMPGATFLTTALQAFANPGLFNWNNAKVWGNGARFDLGLLSDAYNACKLEIPWKH